MWEYRAGGVSVLGMIGGVIGLLMGIVAFIAGGIGALLHIGGAYGFFQSSWIAIFLSIVGMAGAFFAGFAELPGGVAMIVSGALGVYLVKGFFIIPSAILMIAGIIAVFESFRKWDTVTV